MLILYIIDPRTFTGFVFGFVTAIVLIVLLGLWWLDEDEKKQEKAEFEAWKKQKSQRPASLPVVDAEFVLTPKPQLNSSQALVRRGTSLERRNYE